MKKRKEGYAFRKAFFLYFFCVFIIIYIVMRLFIAVLFEDNIKNELLRFSERLRISSVSGNFTSPDNLHLTLAFIGETERIRDIKDIMDGMDFGPFGISLGRMGVFRRDGGDLYWIGLKYDPLLRTAAEYLRSELRKAGFDIENREFKPHITIGRQVALNRGISDPRVSSESMTVRRVSLMRSERINGKLRYTEIYAKELLSSETDH